MSNIDDGQISEPELIVPALRAMRARPGGYISTTDLIGELNAIFQPVGKDAEIINGRQDTHFSQKVRNLKSHRSLEGYAENVANGFRITAAGVAYLDQQGR